MSLTAYCCSQLISASLSMSAPSPWSLLSHERAKEKVKSVSWDLYLFLLLLSDEAIYPSPPHLVLFSSTVDAPSQFASFSSQVSGPDLNTPSRPSSAHGVLSSTWAFPMSSHSALPSPRTPMLYYSCLTFLLIRSSVPAELLHCTE